MSTLLQRVQRLNESYEKSLLLPFREKWDAAGVSKSIGGYGMNSPKGLIHIKKGQGKTAKVFVDHKEMFAGTAEEVADWLNQFFGL